MRVPEIKFYLCKGFCDEHIFYVSCELVGSIVTNLIRQKKQDENETEIHETLAQGTRHRDVTQAGQTRGFEIG